MRLEIVVDIPDVMAAKLSAAQKQDLMQRAMQSAADTVDVKLMMWGIKADDNA